MTFKDWAREYFESADLIAKKIQGLKKELKGNKDIAVVRELNRRITILWSMHKDCIEIADKLNKREGEIL